MKKNLRETARLKRRLRIRKELSGNAERPRLCVFKSSRHIHAQIIDDTKGHTLVSASTLDKESKGKLKATREGAKEIGKILAARAGQKGLKKVIFDRAGFNYHGLLKALAEGAREAGLEF